MEFIGQTTNPFFVDPYLPTDPTPVYYGVRDLVRVLQEDHVETVFLALPAASPEQLLELIECCRHRGVQVRILPSMLELMSTRVTGDQVDGIPLLQLRHGLNTQGPKTAVKRTFDDRTKGNVCSPAVMASYKAFVTQVIPNLKAQVLYK